jgi:phosphoserine phosphatase RsbU/P
LLRGASVDAAFPAACCPVGLIPDVQFASSKIALQPGDTLVLFSDGVSEAMDPDQKEYGVERLKQAVTGQLREPLADMQDTILDSVRQFARGARQADDITVMLVRYKPAASGAKPAAI